MQRNTARRDRYRRQVAKGKPPCHLCGEEIDYQAHHLDPLAFTIHHVIPLAKGGPDEMYLPDGTVQIVAAHRACNREFGDGGKEFKAAVAFVTARSW